VNRQYRDPDRLYGLLPAMFRIADEEKGHQLQALLALINRQADDIRADILQLWDDFFIETCQRWVVPYLGDLVGNTPLHDLDLAPSAATAERLFTDRRGSDLVPQNPVRLRADVAKTISYRRRKGTPATLEELARDVTGWGARAVEFFTLLDWTQNLEHLRPESHGCPDLRSVDLANRAGGPWETATHTVDVRAITEWEGWYDIPNIGFFLWRLKAMPHTHVVPRLITVPSTPPWRFTFSPLGQDTPLFSAGDGGPTDSGRSTELTVDSPIRPAAFFTDLRAAAASRAQASTAYYGPDGGARLTLFTKTATTAPTPVPAKDIECMNLADWTAPAFAQPTGTRIGIDVERGRLALPVDRAGDQLLVSYCDGFSANIGGGEYSRGKWLDPDPGARPVSGGGDALQKALDARSPATETVFEITDGFSYGLTAGILLAPGERLTIQAADGRRPHVRLPAGELSIRTAAAGTTAGLTLNGLLVEGGLRLDGDLSVLRLLHSTLVPGRSVEQETAAPLHGPSVVVATADSAGPVNKNLKVQIAFSIVGALRIPEQVVRLWLLDSIVDGVETAGTAKGAAVSDQANLSGPPAHIERCTLLGTSKFFDLELASETIFSSRVEVHRQQTGCIRFCFIPPDSSTPQLYRCQPDLEISRSAQSAAEVGSWLVPGFEADQYGRPGYAQLRRVCPVQIRTGAEDGAEMGAFCLLKQPQREANLRLRLDEYLPIGLSAGVIYVT
jgi:hypothetical protein